MLNQRQTEILLELFENPNIYMTASSFARKLQVSLRTIQNDIKNIKTELTQYECLEFQSVSPKGSRILIKDPMEFASLKESYYVKLTNVSTSYQDGRVNEILHHLLFQHRSISLYDLENIIHVSSSTLLNDLKRTKDVLKKYNLELLRSSNRIAIDGSELSKRLCILEQNLLIVNADEIFDAQKEVNPVTKIKDILIDTFIQHKQSISETTLTNAILGLYVAVQRMKGSFFLLPGDLNVTESLEPELTICKSIFKKIQEQFYIHVPQEEIECLALRLKGNSNYAESVITPEMDELLQDLLTALRDDYGVNLMDNLNFKIALALHCSSLFIRIKYDMQYKNNLLDHIRSEYPQGYDMATHFAANLQKKLNKRVNDEEIGLIAIHLYNALIEQQKVTGTKNVLVISSMRQSENILLKQKIHNWFDDRIANLNFASPSEITEELLDENEVILTTEQDYFYDMGLALYVNPFPNKKDYLNVKLALDGFNDIEDIVRIFQKDLFTVFPKTNRDKVLKTLCQNASDAFGLEGLHEAVLAREDMRSTYFGNKIAAAHPLSAVSSDTFISVGILPQATEWDKEGNKVHLVLLIGIGKNNHKAFHLWNYLSKLFSDRSFVERLLPDPTYGNFIKQLKLTLADNF